MLLMLLPWFVQRVSQMQIRTPAAHAASAMEVSPGLEIRAPRVLPGHTNLIQDLLRVAIAKQANTPTLTALLTAPSVPNTRPLHREVPSVNACRDTLALGRLPAQAAWLASTRPHQVHRNVQTASRANTLRLSQHFQRAHV